MQTLSNTLLTAQKAMFVTGGAYEPRWKIVLSRAGQTTRGYDMARIIKSQLTIEEDSEVAEVLLDNSDFALNDLNFEQFQGKI